MLPIPEEGTTAIWDAIALTASDVLDKTADQRRRAIILLTDGLDTSSRLRRTDAIDRVLAAEAVVYAIGIGDSKQEGVNKNVLRELAERTVGERSFRKSPAILKLLLARLSKSYERSTCWLIHQPTSAETVLIEK
jgi:hypothetical protein